MWSPSIACKLNRYFFFWTAVACPTFQLDSLETRFNGLIPPGIHPNRLRVDRLVRTGRGAGLTDHDRVTDLDRQTVRMNSPEQSPLSRRDVHVITPDMHGLHWLQHN